MWGTSDDCYRVAQMPPLRPLPSLCDVVTFRWVSGSRLRPGHAFYIQRRLFCATKARKTDPLDRDVDWSLTRKETLIQRSFPRPSSRFWYKILSTMKCIPRFLINLFFYGARYLFLRRPRTQEEKRAVVKSRIGRFFYTFVTQPGCLDSLCRPMRHWGQFHPASGKSMLPTLGASLSIEYASYSYFDRRDIRRGDVVVALGPKYAGNLCKRVAALEGDRVWVTGCNQAPALQRIVSVKISLCP